MRRPLATRTCPGSNGSIMRCSRAMRRIQLSDLMLTAGPRRARRAGVQKIEARKDSLRPRVGPRPVRHDCAAPLLRLRSPTKKNQGVAAHMVFWLTTRPGWVLVLFLFIFTALAMMGPYLVRLRVRLARLRGNN